MKKLFLFLVSNIMMFLGACGSRTPKESNCQEQAIRMYVADFLDCYPKATLQDIYKGCFQDYFGPAHIINDRKTAKSYILSELATADTLGGDYYEPCGWRRQYYRVNLSVVRDGLIDIDRLVDAFVKSAQGEPTFTHEWSEEWNTIQQIVRERYPALQGFSKDSLQIARLLSEGNYVMHHSSIFNEYYCPHYRIVHCDIFNKEILPSIEP